MTALLDEAVVDTAYKCYDCKHLFAQQLRCTAQLSALACQHYCLLRALTEESKEPPLEKSTTVTAAATQAEINEEFIRFLERQFAKHQLESEQARAHK